MRCGNDRNSRLNKSHTGKHMSLTASISLLTLMQAGVPASVGVAPTELALGVDQTVRITATVLDSEGQEIEFVLRWFSADPAVATVDVNGRITGIGEGQTRVVAAAGEQAAVMVGVFAAFATSRILGLQQFGVGLAVAVFIDATIIRVVLLPASMKLLGEWNWYLPAWLEWLPRVTAPDAEPFSGQSETAPAPGND